MWRRVLGFLGMLLGSVPDVRHRQGKATAHVLEFDILGLQSMNI